MCPLFCPASKLYQRQFSSQKVYMLLIPPPISSFVKNLRQNVFGMYSDCIVNSLLNEQATWLRPSVISTASVRSDGFHFDLGQRGGNVFTISILSRPTSFTACWIDISWWWILVLWLIWLVLWFQPTLFINLFVFFIFIKQTCISNWLELNHFLKLAERRAGRRL